MSLMALAQLSEIVAQAPSKARKLFVTGELKFDDYSEIKKEHQTNTEHLKKQLNTVVNKLKKH